MILMKTCRALTIAGSDSGGGAGIQADLKTFAAFKVYGMTAITAITAQNTTEVRGIHVLPSEIVAMQIDCVVEDIGVDSAKTGMLYNREIIEVVANKIIEYNIPVVIDPVMIAKSGAKLLLDEAIEAVKRKLIPIATVITPNIPEAEEIVGYKIKNVEDMEKAAEDIFKKGAEAVVVKGGHLKGNEVIDILYYKDKIFKYKKKKILRKTTHGTGCSFSAAIAALIAKGHTIPEAVEKASKFMEKTVKFGLEIGKGHGPVNPMAILYENAEKYHVWKNVSKALKIIENSPELIPLIPEVRMNIGEASPYAETIQDVCAIDGRITLINGRLKGAGCPKFGASKHVARIILAAMEIDQETRAAMNIKYNKEILAICRKIGMKIAKFSRDEEPIEIKKIEGSTLQWGIRRAIRDLGEIPDIIYDEGERGKEPMIRILGKNAIEVVLKAKKIGKLLK